MNTFEIHAIRFGWFQICFSPHAEKQGFLTNSDYLCCDAPALFLDALANILEKRSAEEWLCWQDEPGASILRLSLEDGKVAVGIYTAERDAVDLPYSGAELASEEKTLYYENSFEIKRLLDDVLVEFSLYENGNGRALYNKHWGEFPGRELQRLKEFAAEFNNGLDKYGKMFYFSY